LDEISIRGLQVDCVVGVYPNERDVLQPLCLDVWLSIDTERAAVAERIGYTVDYDAISRQIVFLLKSCRFGLLETAAHALARYLLAPPADGERRAAVESLRLQLTKPAALKAGAVASVSIARDRHWVKLDRELKPFGTVDIIFETREAGIYRLNVAPGGTIPMHVHRRMQESEMVLGEGLLCQNRPVQHGSVFRWPSNAPHSYRNPTDRWQSILCVDRPRFIEDDEVVVDAPPADIEPQSVFEL
jgi:dihydroneopterin aldolase